MAGESPSPAPTWQPPPDFEQFGGDLDAAERRGLPDSAFAFPRQRKEPLCSASHVRSALSRFDQVTDVGDADRALAFENIRLAASYFDVHMTEKSWHDLRPHAAAADATGPAPPGDEGDDAGDDDAGKDFVDLGVERRFTEAAAMADARAQMAVDRGFVPVSRSAVRPPGPQSTAGLTDGSTYSQ